MYYHVEYYRDAWRWSASAVEKETLDGVKEPGRVVWKDSNIEATGKCWTRKGAIKAAKRSIRRIEQEMVREEKMSVTATYSSLEPDSVRN